MLKIDGENHSRFLETLRSILNEADSFPLMKSQIAEASDLLIEAGFTSVSEETLIQQTPDGHRVPARGLNDQDLHFVNSLLPWSSYFVDSDNRINGNIYNSKKRVAPEKMQDRRVKKLADFCNDAPNQRVVEYGCFEGNHTVQLCSLFGNVTALDGRIENALKTLVRAWLLNQQPSVECINLETTDKLPQTDASCHIGVLYHLKNAPHHLVDVLKATKDVLLLDSQVASEAQLNQNYDLNGHSISVYRYREKDISFSPFAGMLPEAIWLSPDTINQIAEENGFKMAEQTVVEERNGLRGTFYLKRV